MVFHYKTSKACSYRTFILDIVTGYRVKYIAFKPERSGSFFLCYKALYDRFSCLLTVYGRKCYDPENEIHNYNDNLNYFAVNYCFACNCTG